MENEKIWYEVFSQGDVWHLRVDDDKKELIAEPLEGDSEDYPEAKDLGISNIQEKARIMGLKLIILGDD